MFSPASSKSYSSLYTQPAYVPQPHKVVWPILLNHITLLKTLLPGTCNVYAPVLRKHATESINQLSTTPWLSTNQLSTTPWLSTNVIMLDAYLEEEKVDLLGVRVFLLMHTHEEVFHIHHQPQQPIQLICVYILQVRYVTTWQVTTDIEHCHRNDWKQVSIYQTVKWKELQTKRICCVHMLKR